MKLLCMTAVFLCDQLHASLIMLSLPLVFHEGGAFHASSLFSAEDGQGWLCFPVIPLLYFSNTVYK